jgi:hypothetical protein
MAAARKKGTMSVPPPSEAIAGAFQSPVSFTDASISCSQYASAANVGGISNGAFCTQGFGGSLNVHPSMRHQAFDPSTW